MTTADTSSQTPMPPRRRALVWGVVLLLLPLLILLVLWGTATIDRDTAQATLTGILIAASGGIVAGITAERFLHRGRGELENLVGLGLTTFVGVLTVGYLYIGHIRGPMSSIATFPRAIRQGLSFLAFLMAQGTGILLGIAVVFHHSAEA
mgnify:CR=1 FL=1